MKVYLDNSVLNRPFDDQSIPQIRLETSAFLALLSLIDEGKVAFVNSSVIEYENSKNPFPGRKVWIKHFLLKADPYQKINLSVKQAAQKIEKLKIAPIDALHLACAEHIRADCFITCDYDILKKYTGSIQVINPIQFIMNNRDTYHDDKNEPKK